MLAVTPTSATADAAPCAAGEFSWLQIPGWRMDFDSGIEGAKRAMAAEAKRAEKRAGARGKGSKPARSRSIKEFSEGFGTVASDRSYARTARKNKKAAQREEDKASGRLAELRAELQAAKDAVLAGTATPEQKLLDMQADDRAFFMQRYAADQTAWERIVTVGYVHPGGMVGRKYYRAPFVEKGLRSWRHPYFQRIVASIGRAASRTLRTGPEKDKCVLQYKKLPACDETYAFFCSVCRDLFRLDLDMTFRSEAHLRAWIADIVRENNLPCGPHIIDWIPDDRFPGEVIHPQLFFLLPEGNAVWPSAPPQQHAMLGQVIAGLTKVFKGDPGGLAHPFSGKNPVSPTVTAEVYQDTHMPMLCEYFEALGCAFDPVRMFRHMLTEQMEGAGFDKDDSNSWFTLVAKLATTGAQDLHIQGFPTADAERLKKRIIKMITPEALEAIQPTPAQRKTVNKLILACARFAAESFDASKMDAKGRDRGAAAHLIEATDSLEVRKQKGKAYSDAVKITETRAIITKAIRIELAAGREPTVASITASVPRCFNTVRKHFFACYQTAVASISLESLLRGSTNLPGISLPPQSVLRTANSASDLPWSWGAAHKDPVLVDRFRAQALRRARIRKAGKRIVSVPIPGRRMIDFMSAGPVTVYRAATVSQSA